METVRRFPVQKISRKCYNNGHVVLKLNETQEVCYTCNQEPNKPIKDVYLYIFYDQPYVRYAGRFPGYLEKKHSNRLCAECSAYAIERMQGEDDYMQDYIDDCRCLQNT